MNLKQILEYQKKDGEVIKLERELNSNENKKIYTQMVAIVKDAQTKSNILEKQAAELNENYEQLKRTYEENIKSANIISNKNIEEVSDSDLNMMEEIAQTIINNLTILEKKLKNQAEKVNAVLRDFEQTKIKYNQAKEKYNTHKKLFDEVSLKLQPEIDNKNAELKKLEKNIDETILAKYKKRRTDNIFPVLVPAMEKACGGCRMELSSSSLSDLKNNGMLECEHCRRIIYNID